MNCKIAIAYHKESPILNHPYLLPVHAGKALSGKNLNIQGDAEGDNISAKNSWYCEMTVLYWLWKNTKADYKGLMHYRRVFVVKPTFFLKKVLLGIKYITRRISSVWNPYSSLFLHNHVKYRSFDSFNKDVADFSSQLESLLKDGTNIIAPCPCKFYMRIKRTLCWEVGGWSIDLMDRIVKEMFPDFYPYYTKAMNGLVFYKCNMSVMDNETFEEYCTILFGILERHEELTVSEGYLKDVSTDKAYARMSGYLAEMLTNAYIQYCIATGKKIKELPVGFLAKA